jgi:hypothetical protein
MVLLQKVIAEQQEFLHAFIELANRLEYQTN